MQRVSVVLVDVTLVLGVIAWCGGRTRDNGQEKSAKGMAANEGDALSPCYLQIFVSARG